MIFPVISSSSSAGVASYAIAQHVANPLRMEARNIGVFVEKSGVLASRFIGEVDGGKWDVPKIKRIANPNAYRLWVDHWRKEIGAGSKSLDSLARDRESSFKVVPGGEVRATGSDSPEEICNYLFSTLVSTEGLAGFFDENEEGRPATVLGNDLHVELRRLKITASYSGVRHPVYHNFSVAGKHHWHQVTFYQESQESAWVIEPVDFSQKRKVAARNQAAYARCVFDDLLAAGEVSRLSVRTVAVIRASESDMENDDAKYGLELLEGNCEIINWTKPAERDAFLKRTEQNALAA